MKIHQTSYQKSIDQYPSRIDFETIAYHRGLLKTTEEKQNYYRTLAGAKGEATVVEYLKKYGKPHWVIIQNLWQQFSGPFECDLILLTRHKGYSCEIKNYKGTFSYDAGITRINGHIRSVNPFHQARLAYTSLEQICRQHSNPIEFQGVVIFTGIDNHIEIQSEMKDLEIIPRTRLLTFIESIAEEEAEYTGEPINIDQTLSCFETQEINNKFLPEPVTEEKMRTAKKGICCANCQSYNIQNQKFKIICNQCGFIENREEAVVRTICDYGVLNFDKNLKFKHIWAFFGGQVSKNYLSKIIHRHFTVVDNGSYSYVVNNKSPYIKIRDKFKFK